MRINKSNIILGLITIILATSFLLAQEMVVIRIVDWMLYFLIALNALVLVYNLWNRKKEKKSIFPSVFNVVVLSIFKLLNQATLISPAILVILVGIYQVMIAAVYFITFFLYFKHKVKGKYRYLIDAIILSILGLSTIFNPFKHLDGQYIILSFYLLFLGLRYLREGFFYYTDLNKKDLRRKVRFHVPIIFEALLPGKAWNKVNDLVTKGAEDVISDIEDKNEGFEIFVHATEGMQGATGHIDICVDDVVISYGCYDSITTRLFGTISDGTLIKCNREEYINFCKETKDLIFGYSIRINEIQKAAILNKIKQLDELLIDWKLDEEKHKELNTQAYQLSKLRSIEFYKFKQSKFKTYFVATTNCCVLADSIIGEMGSDILNVRGFITPGTYKNYLDREFEKGNGFVAGYNVY